MTSMMDNCCPCGKLATLIISFSSGCSQDFGCNQCAEDGLLGDIRAIQETQMVQGKKYAVYMRFCSSCKKITDDDRGYCDNQECPECEEYVQGSDDEDSNSYSEEKDGK